MIYNKSTHLQGYIPTSCLEYRIVGTFRWCKFSHKLEISLRIKFKFSNISWACVYNREAQGVLSQFLFSHKRHVFELCENLHHSKISRYTVYSAIYVQCLIKIFIVIHIQVNTDDIIITSSLIATTNHSSTKL